jgi:hypothetical protein
MLRGGSLIKSEMRVFHDKNLYSSVSPTSFVVTQNNAPKCVQEVFLQEGVDGSAATSITASVNDCIEAFAWSCDGRLLATTAGIGRSEIRVIDCVAKRFWSAGPEIHPGMVCHLAWSHNCEYLASASLGCEDDARSLRLWRGADLFQTAEGNDGITLLAPGSTVGCPKTLEDLHWYEDQACGFFGYGSLSFNPQSSQLAAVAIVRDEFGRNEDYRADDWILVFDVPSLKEIESFEVPGQIIDVAWSSNSHLVFCGLNRCSYLLETSSETITEIGIPADMCRINPVNSIAAFCLGRGLHYARNYDHYYAELHDVGKNHSVTLADWRTGSILHQHTDDGCVTDMAWSLDGTRLYILSDLGKLYTYQLS